MRYILIILCLFGLNLHQSSAQVSLNASLDTNIIRIGEQIHLTLEAQYNVSQQAYAVQFPTFKDTIIEGLEIIDQSTIDTALVDPTNDPYTFKLKQEYLVTSFDSGLYVIPPFQFTVNGEVQESSPLVVQVATIAVDTTKGIVDIVEPVNLPITFGEYLSIYKSTIYWTLAIIAILVVLWLVYKKYFKNRPVAIKIKKEPEIPAHEQALQLLLDLKSKNYFEQGLVKQHYVEVTGILRAYFERRYAFLALELTSDEILREVRLYKWTTEQYDGLQKLLTLADLVKFAKEAPTKNDIDWSLQYAEQLVLSIKVEEKPEEETDEDNA